MCCAHACREVADACLSSSASSFFTSASAVRGRTPWSFPPLFVDPTANVVVAAAAAAAAPPARGGHRLLLLLLLLLLILRLLPLPLLLLLLLRWLIW